MAYGHNREIEIERERVYTKIQLHVCNNTVLLMCIE